MPISLHHSKAGDDTVQHNALAGAYRLVAGLLLSHPCKTLYFSLLRWTRSRSTDFSFDWLIENVAQTRGDALRSLHLCTFFLVWCFAFVSQMTLFWCTLHFFCTPLSGANSWRWWDIAHTARHDNRTQTITDNTYEWNDPRCKERFMRWTGDGLWWIPVRRLSYGRGRKHTHTRIACWSKRNHLKPKKKKRLSHCRAVTNTSTIYLPPYAGCRVVGFRFCTRFCTSSSVGTAMAMVCVNVR